MLENPDSETLVVLLVDGKFCLRNQESWALESGISLTIGVRNPVPPSETGILAWNPGSMAWNLESNNLGFPYISLRSKRFQSSYCAKVRAGAKKKVKGVIPFFCSRPNFLDKLARKHLLRRLPLHLSGVRVRITRETFFVTSIAGFNFP